MGTSKKGISKCDGVTFGCGENEIWLEDITVEKEYRG